MMMRDGREKSLFSEMVIRRTKKGESEYEKIQMAEDDINNKEVFSDDLEPLTEEELDAMDADTSDDDMEAIDEPSEDDAQEDTQDSAQDNKKNTDKNTEGKNTTNKNVNKSTTKNSSK